MQIKTQTETVYVLTLNQTEMNVVVKAVGVVPGNEFTSGSPERMALAVLWDQLRSRNATT